MNILGKVIGLVLGAAIYVTLAGYWVRRNIVPLYLAAALVSFGYELRDPSAHGMLGVLWSWSCAMIWPWRVWARLRQARPDSGVFVVEDLV